MSQGTDSRHKDRADQANYFFKHKYLTQPTITDADAILHVADNMCQALMKVVSERGATRNIIDHMMDIFKQETKKAETPTDVQKVQSDKAELEQNWL